MLDWPSTGWVRYALLQTLCAHADEGEEECGGVAYEVLCCLTSLSRRGCLVTSFTLGRSLCGLSVSQGLLYDLFYAGLDCKKFTKDLEDGGIFAKYKGANPCKDKKDDFKFDGIETLLQKEFGLLPLPLCTPHP